MNQCLIFLFCLTVLFTEIDILKSNKNEKLQEFTAPSKTTNLKFSPEDKKYFDRFTKIVYRYQDYSADELLFYLDPFMSFRNMENLAYYFIEDYKEKESTMYYKDLNKYFSMRLMNHVVWARTVDGNK